MERCRFDVNMTIRALKLAALMTTDVTGDDPTEMERAEYIADEIYAYCDYLDNIVLASMPLPDNRAVLNAPLYPLSDNR